MSLFIKTPNAIQTTPSTTDFTTEDDRTLAFDFSPYVGTTSLSNLGTALLDSRGNPVTLEDAPGSTGAQLTQRVRGSALVGGQDFVLLAWAKVATGNIESGLLVIHCIL